jgi:hypothetical protein
MITKFEEIKNNKYRYSECEIVLRQSSYAHSLHLLLQDVNINDEWIEQIHIGVISTNVNNVNYASLIFNTENEKISKFRNGTFRHLTEGERDLVYNAIKSGKYKGYIDIIKNATDIDLRELIDYKNWLIEQEAKKYNI